MAHTQDFDRLYVVVRGDLPSGSQLAQAVHAAFDFSVQHPLLVRRWNQDSNYLVVLSAPDEDVLCEIAARAAFRGVESALIREPDFGNEATAIALSPGPVSRRICANLPLALKERAVA